jgi:hypothetical protein
MLGFKITQMKTTNTECSLAVSSGLVKWGLAAAAVLLAPGAFANDNPLPIGPGRPGFDPDRVAIGVNSIALLSVPEKVYDNLSTPLGNYLGGFAYEEVGDDVALAGTARVFESVTVSYAGFDFDGDETLTLSLYAMDGPPTPGSFGFNTPGSVLLSTTVPIAETPGATVTVIDPSPSVVLPDVVGVGLSFGGVDFDPTGAGSDAGPLLFDPPSAGSSLDDYWLRGFPSPETLGLYTFGGNPSINRGADHSRGAKQWSAGLRSILTPHLGSVREPFVGSRAEG